MRQRVQRVLAAAGVASRRRSEELIRAGLVTVDGVVAHIGDVVDPESQVIAVDGRPLTAEPKEYWLLNKPLGVVSTAADPQGRPTVVDCVPSGARLYPVGRLDRDTSGLLILTNDGDLAHRLLHPRFGVEKEYVLTARGRVPDEALDRLRQGVRLEEGRTSPAGVQVRRRTEKETELVLVIHEGKKRQVRRMLEAVGHPVVRLHRTRVDGLTDKDIRPGQARRLTDDEVARLSADTDPARSSGDAPSRPGRTS